MHTGAHPDDEDSALLARLARGDHARVVVPGAQPGRGRAEHHRRRALRSAGCNPHRGTAAGAAHRRRGPAVHAHGGLRLQQDARGGCAVWGEEIVLDDMVRAIRAYRPLVVDFPVQRHAERWPRPPSAGRLPDADRGRARGRSVGVSRRIAATGCGPWRVRKVYVGEGFRPADRRRPGAARRDRRRRSAPRAFLLRAGHGRPQPAPITAAGHARAPWATVERPATAPGRGTVLAEALVAPMFSGIDTSIAGIPSLAGAPAGTLAAELASRADCGRARPGGIPAADSVEHAAVDSRRARGGAPCKRRRADRSACDEAVREELAFRLDAKERDFVDAAVRASGVVVDALAADETVAPGESLNVSIKTFFPAVAQVRVVSARLAAPETWRVAAATAVTSPGGRGRGAPETARHEAAFSVAVPADATPTEPYWLTTARQGALFTWPDDAPKGQPFGAPPLEAVVDTAIGTSTITVRRPVEFRTADPIRGELRRRVDVVPAISVAVDTSLAIVPISSASTRRDIIVEAENLSRSGVQGTLRVRVPAGWSVKPAEAPFVLPRAGERASARFAVTVPARAAAGRYNLESDRVRQGIDYTSTATTIAYPHIQTHRLYTRAVTGRRGARPPHFTAQGRLHRGHGRRGRERHPPDGTPRHAARCGHAGDGDLSQFDTIVVGIRAAEVRPDFVANHRRLMQFVENGGALIVQYQPPDYASQGLPPFPAEVGTRITDETARVTLLQPEHRVFTSPNRIVPVRLGRLGAGAIGQQLGDLRSAVCAARRGAGSWRAGAARRPAPRRGGTRRLRVYVVRMVPPAAGRRSRSLSALRESARARQSERPVAFRAGTPVV